MDTESDTFMRPYRTLRTVGICTLLVVAAFWLWRDHRDHAASVAPFLLLLACPLIHFFGHRKHHQHRDA